jgi:hypothetical protein
MLTTGAAKLLFLGSHPSHDGHYIMQIILIQTRVLHIGCNQIILTSSDGEHCIDCLVAPHLFPLFDGCKVYMVVEVGKCNFTSVSAEVKVILVDMLVKSVLDDVIGEPCYIREMKKRSLEECNIDVRNSKEKVVSLMEDKLKCPPVDEAALPEKESGCDNCNQQPCEWTDHGPSIIDMINHEYVGRYVDADGNVLEASDGVHGIIGNKQLRFIAYTAYSFLKHGYLGKKNRMKIPHCVECVIQNKHPGSTSNYVGFKDSHLD